MRLNGLNALNVTTNGLNEYLAILDEAWQAHLAPRHSDAPTVVSLFAGCGGSSLGYSMAGYRELLAVEWDAHAVVCFKLNFPNVPVFHGDIAKLSSEEALRLAGLQPGELDVLDGSPPCQGFSTAGKRILADPRNGLFSDYVRLLEVFKPKAFVMENVSGMIKGKMKLVFAEMIRALKGCGYKVSARLMNAMYFHVPQSRERMIFIGVRDDLKILPSHSRTIMRPFVVREALQELTDEPSLRVRLGPGHKTFQQMSVVRSGDRDSRHYSHHRLAWNSPSPTIDRGGGAGAYHVWHPSEHRPLTVSEIKRIFSYPDCYRFDGSVTNIFERIGNSVPPLFMRAIAAHIATLLTPQLVES
jgi:DNA (cytosine-5)-methyltransferase 1